MLDTARAPARGRARNLGVGYMRYLLGRPSSRKADHQIGGQSMSAKRDKAGHPCESLDVSF